MSLKNAFQESVDSASFVSSAATGRSSIVDAGPRDLASRSRDRRALAMPAQRSAPADRLVGDLGRVAAAGQEGQRPAALRPRPPGLGALESRGRVAAARHLVALGVRRERRLDSWLAMPRAASASAIRSRAPAAQLALVLGDSGARTARRRARPPRSAARSRASTRPSLVARVRRARRRARRPFAPCAASAASGGFEGVGVRGRSPPHARARGRLGGLALGLARRSPRGLGDRRRLRRPRCALDAERLEQLRLDLAGRSRGSRPGTAWCCCGPGRAAARRRRRTSPTSGRCRARARGRAGSPRSRSRRRTRCRTRPG